MLMARRGVSPEAAGRHLSAPLESLSPPEVLPGAGDALQRLRQAAESGETVLVHGDYDVDGITATVIMLRALRAAGARPLYHIPHRIDEGYGLGEEGVAAALEAGAGLLVTVDCGTNAAAEVEELASHGVDTVVTDHHRPDSVTARPTALVNPALEGEASSPWSALSGAGLAYQLARGLPGLRPDSPPAGALLGLAAMGTVCDMVPLEGDNRVIVSRGLAALRDHPPAGVRALASTGRTSSGDLTERDLAFVLGPRLNSCGRLARAEMAVELLMEEDPRRAAPMAAEIEALNGRRRRIGEGIWREITDRCREGPDGRSLVMGSPHWHRGVVGIACSRAARRWGTPSVLVALDGEMGYGSARSVPGVSMHGLLSDSADLLEGFGGHHMAAGLRVRADRLEPLAERLESLLADRPGELFGPVLYVDGRLREGEISMRTLRALEALRPFGEGNAEPVWISRRVRLEDPRLVGSARRHLCCSVVLGGRRHRAIGFGMAGALPLLPGPVDVAYRLQEDHYRGGGTVQLVLEGIRRAAGDGV
jgi:single-stranded-DNA-specific exonuclease